MTAPDLSLVTKARYGYSLFIYVGATGEKILSGTDAGRIQVLIKSDNPTVKDNLFPVLVLYTSMNTDEKNKLQKNRDDLIIKLSLTVRNERVELTNEITVISQRVLWEHKFQAMLRGPDDTNMATANNTQVVTNPDGTYTAPSPDMAEKFTVAVFDLSCIEHRNEMKQVINFNLSDNSPESVVTMADTLAYGLTQIMTTPKSVIFQQPDRVTPFKQVIVPPWNFKDVCKHLQTVYGVYSSGMLVYRDLDFLYVIPYTSKDYAIKENDYNQVHIYQYDNGIAGSLQQATGMYVDKDMSRYVITQPKTYKIQSITEFLKETAGNKFRVFSPESAEASSSYQGNEYSFQTPLPESASTVAGNKNAVDKVKYFNNELSNDYIVTSHIKKLEQSTEVLSITVQDVDISIMTFNRSYTMVFPDDLETEAKYGGTYNLLFAESQLKTSGSEPLSSKTALFFVRDK